MTERNQQTLANALGIIGVILLAGSLFAITVYKRALDETLYKEAIAQSQIYTVVADIVERKVIESVIVWEKDLITKLVPDRIVDNNPIASQVLTFILDTVVEEQTPNYISGLFDKVDLENVLRSMTEKKIDSDIGWLKGEQEAGKIFEYIPTPEQIDKLKEDNVAGLVNGLVTNFLGSNDTMPQCQNDEEIYQNLERIAGGDTQGVTCTSPQIAPFLVNQQDIKGVTQVADALDTKIAVVTQESRITALLGDIYNVSKTIAELKVMVLEFRADVQGIIRWLYVIFGVGCIVCAVGIFYTRAGERIKRSILLLFTTGFAVSFVALLHYLIFSRLLMRAIPFDKMAIGSTVLTPTEVTALTDSIRFIVEYIITGLVSLSFTLGIWVMGGAAVLYGIYMTFVHRCEITTYMRNLRKKSIT